MHGSAFRAYACPRESGGRAGACAQVAPGDVVVMDNSGSGSVTGLPAHSVAGVRDTIEAAGARLLYLPSDWPDLHPVEMAFSKPCSWA